MLSARHRLRHPADFSAVIRHGARAGRPALVVHLLLDPADGAPAGTPARVGFAVPRTVGPAVVRNRVIRRLRALSTARIDQAELFPPGSRVVVRALPPAATAPYAVLGEQLDAALEAAARKAGSLVAG